MEELNKKLAEWRFAIVTQIFMPDGWVPKGRICFFEFPNPEDESEENESYDTCDLFTLSLDACFKWLVPKYESQYGIYRKAELLCEWLDLYENTQEYKDNPALALCKAMEKVIDG